MVGEEREGERYRPYACIVALEDRPLLPHLKIKIRQPTKDKKHMINTETIKYIYFVFALYVTPELTND